MEAISKLTNRPKSVNETINRDINLARIFGSVSQKDPLYKFKDNPPTACFLVAACLLGTYKSPECWTASDVDEVCTAKPV